MANEKRLIDAYALSDAVRGISKGMRRPGAVELATLCLIAEADIVDAVEVVHGRWIYEPVEFDWKKDIKCSVCGEYVNYTSNYCPNCGAKMDGDGNA